MSKFQDIIWRLRCWLIERNVPDEIEVTITFKNRGTAALVYELIKIEAGPLTQGEDGYDGRFHVHGTPVRITYRRDDYKLDTQKPPV